MAGLKSTHSARTRENTARAFAVRKSAAIEIESQNDLFGRFVQPENYLHVLPRPGNRKGDCVVAAYDCNFIATVAFFAVVLFEARGSPNVFRNGRFDLENSLGGLLFVFAAQKQINVGVFET